MAYGVLQFEAGYDLADIGQFTIDVEEIGGSGATFTATISSGKFFLRTDASSATGYFPDKVTSYTPFIDELETQLNAGTGGGAYTVTFDASTSRVTITHDGGGSITSVTLTPGDNAALIGHDDEEDGALSYELGVAPYYWIDAAVGWWSAWSGDVEEESEGIVDVVTHDGEPHGIAPDGVAVRLDFVVPLEPWEAVESRKASTLTPWTWQHLFQHCRNVEPIAVYDGEETHFIRLRRDGAFFRPRKITRDYVGEWDIEIRSRVLARL